MLFLWLIFFWLSKMRVFLYNHTPRLLSKAMIFIHYSFPSSNHTVWVRLRESWKEGKEQRWRNRTVVANHVLAVIEDKENEYVLRVPWGQGNGYFSHFQPLIGDLSCRNCWVPRVPRVQHWLKQSSGQKIDINTGAGCPSFRKDDSSILRLPRDLFEFGKRSKQGNKNKKTGERGCSSSWLN